MTVRAAAREVEQSKVMDEAFRGASERAKISPDGMRETARGLRERAAGLPDNCDRDAMLRLAAGFERRAVDAEQPARSNSAAAQRRNLRTGEIR